ncbi:hypothetical protein Gasu2_62330 [Galdieria sulphuraria]|nr:hypothetical protein Gasu2_62330 [Galdieria sulphuraria]
MAIEKTKALRALKHLGKVSTQFEFSFYIDRIENVPLGVDFIFSVQRGERLCSSTECRSVQLAYRSSGVVAFRELLVLPVTLYMNKVEGDFLPKYAKFFLRRVGKAGVEPKTQEAVFQLSDGSKLFMTISWKVSKSDWENDSKDSIVKAFEKVVSGRIFGNEVRRIEPRKLSLNPTDAPGSPDKNSNLKECKFLASERKYSLGTEDIRKPRQSKGVLLFGERNQSFDDSKAVREGVLQKLTEENSLLLKYLVEIRSEMEHNYLIEGMQKAEICKLRAELQGFRDTFPKDGNGSESSRDKQRIVETNKELLEQFRKLEEHYKSQVRSLFGEVYKLKETMTLPSFASNGKLDKFASEPSASQASTARDRIPSQDELASLEWKASDHRDTQIHYLRKQLLLQREESGNLLSELIRTKLSLALALESVEWLSFENKKHSRQNKSAISEPLWTKILPWKFE